MTMDWMTLPEPMLQYRWSCCDSIVCGGQLVAWLLKEWVLLPPLEVMQSPLEVMHLWLELLPGYRAPLEVVSGVRSGLVEVIVVMMC